MQITTIGLDIAKNVFQVHGIDAAEKVVVRKQLRRGQVIAFFAALPPCLIGMEACATAHYWARELTRFGHEVRLMPAKDVKAYVTVCPSKEEQATTTPRCSRSGTTIIASRKTRFGSADRFIRMWEYYLAGFEVSFRSYGLAVFQIQLIKNIDSVPLTRGYMYKNTDAGRGACAVSVVE